MINGINWYRLSIEEVLKKLNADVNGLTSNEAQERLKKYGLNELQHRDPMS